MKLPDDERFVIATGLGDVAIPLYCRHREPKPFFAFCQVSDEERRAFLQSPAAAGYVGAHELAWLDGFKK